MSCKTGVPSEARAMRDTPPPTDATSVMPRLMVRSFGRSTCAGTLSLVLTLGCYACAAYAPPAAPSPQTATIAVAPDSAWQRTLTYLAGAGIAVSASDKAGGVITARPAMTPAQKRSWVDCGQVGAKPAAEMPQMQTVVTTGQLSVSITPSGSGSAIRPSFVVTQSQAMPIMGSRTTVSCVSSGALERELLAALAR